MEKSSVYSLDESKKRLLPSIASLASTLEMLPDEATPDDVAVAKFTIHPSYLAKSFFPERFLRGARLDALGSKYVQISPERRLTRHDEEFLGGSDLFVAGTRENFRELASYVESLREGTPEAEQFAYLERISPFNPAEKLHFSAFDDEEVEIELALHLPQRSLLDSPRERFADYARASGFELSLELSFSTRGLWFVPARGRRSDALELAQFSLLRVARDMPALQGLPSPGIGRRISQQIELPTAGAISPNLRVAILDGGLQGARALDPWVNTAVEMNPDAEDLAAYSDHGTGVTSAFLFGPLVPGVLAPRPFAEVDHYRILDSSTSNEDSFELYRTLGYIEEILLTRSYEFINLSLGPALPIEDDEVHAWTAVIDDRLSDGRTLMTVAVGNNGASDRDSGNARIQVPSDSVNALSVGASAGTDIAWNRAFYSAVGPGRSPGVIKPDLLAHGGDHSDYFHVVARGSGVAIEPQMGTSFSAPLALRSAAAIRSVMGDDISTLGIKALLINAARRQSNHEQIDVGWGKLPDDIASLITSPDGVARIIFEGELKPGKYLRAPVPLPTVSLKGMVTIGATFCFASAIDPQAPDAYTRAGLQVTFRRDINNIKDGAGQAPTSTFFSPKAFATENNLRSDNGKWETVLNAKETMQGRTLVEPAFDIHYVARSESAQSDLKDSMRYALVVDIVAPKHLDLFESILDAYPGLLVELQPQVNIRLGA